MRRQALEFREWLAARGLLEDSREGQLMFALSYNGVSMVYDDVMRTWLCEHTTLDGLYCKTSIGSEIVQDAHFTIEALRTLVLEAIRNAATIALNESITPSEV